MRLSEIQKLSIHIPGKSEIYNDQDECCGFDYAFTGMFKTRGTPSMTMKNWIAQGTIAPALIKYLTTGDAVIGLVDIADTLGFRSRFSDQIAVCLIARPVLYDHKVAAKRKTGLEAHRSTRQDPSWTS